MNDDVFSGSSIPLKTIVVDENLQIINVGIKFVVLRKTSSDPAKLMIGIKLEPKPDLSKSAYDKAVEHIENGSYTSKSGKFRDYISVKITNTAHLKDIVFELAQAIGLLYRENGLDQTYDDMGDFLMKIFKDGWTHPITNLPPRVYLPDVDVENQDSSHDSTVAETHENENNKGEE